MSTPSTLSPAVGPRTIGELLDGAVTIFVRNAGVFIALAAIVYVPVAISQLSMGDFWQWYLDSMRKVLTSPAGSQAPIAFDRQLLARAGPMYIVQLIVWIAGAPLVTAAMVHVTSNILVGRTTTFADSMRFALPRWGVVVLYSLVWGIAVVASFFVLMLALGFLIAALAAVLRSAAVVAIVIFFAVMLLAMLGALIAMVSGGVGLATVIVESTNAFSAFAAGIERTINRQYFWRSVLMGLVILAIGIGFSLVASMVGFGLLVSLHTGIPLVIINGLVSIVQFGFGIVFIVLYYYDLRVRREGVDLESLAAQLSAPVSQPLAQ